MKQPVTIDYRLAVSEGTGRNDSPSADHLTSKLGEVSNAIEAFLARVETGELGFFDLPKDDGAWSRTKEVAGGVSEEVTDVLLLGIGGSSLGARTVLHALGGPFISASERRTLHLPDNTDPWTLSAILDRLDPKTTVAVVTSKSGGTVETAAQMLVVRAWLEGGVGREALGRHLIAITDPTLGPLRQLATEQGWATLPIPSNVGGRFSVLTAVGLLPLALAGLDGAELLRGARDMRSACAERDPTRNPAAVLAQVHVQHHQGHGRAAHVLMPYSDTLKPLANWWVQLWAESLGKRLDREGQTVEVGPTAIAGVGATDQHAQVQLFMEGPRDKLITFIAVRTPERDLAIPESDGAFSYLGGHSMHGLLEAERRATRQALARDGRPSITLEVARADAYHLGALLFLFETTTAIAGELYDINAFDQPGVEAGKRLAYGMLGRKGFEDAAEEVRKFESAEDDSLQLR